MSSKRARCSEDSSDVIAIDQDLHSKDIRYEWLEYTLLSTLYIPVSTRIYLCAAVSRLNFRLDFISDKVPKVC